MLRLCNDSSIPLILFLVLLNIISAKKDIRDYTDAEMEKLYEQWEENDQDELSRDELPNQKKPPNIDLDSLRKKAKSPDELIKLTKRGQSVMMFVSVKNPALDSSTKTPRDFTDRMSSFWQTNFFNNHIDAQVFIVDDDRVLFLFREGSQAWDAKDFLIKQPECKEVVLEGKTFPGTAQIPEKEL